QGEDVPSTYDITLKRKDDTIVSAEIHVSIFEHNNSPASLVMVRDITARLEREKALKENERNLRSLYNSMNEGVCQHEMVYDDLGKAVDYRVIDANQKYEEILNLKRENAVGKLASEIYGADEPPYLDIYAEVAETGQSTKFETYFAPMKRHFSISVFSPRKGKFATVFDDITQRKNVELALEESEDKFRTITEHSPDAIFITDQRGNYLYVNQAASDLLGYSVEELTTMKISDISEITQREESMMQFQKLMKEGHLFAELRLVRKDGSVIPTDINAVVLPNGLVYGSCRDLIEQKKAEKILKSKVDELESYKKATIGRELKMVKLKEEIKSLKEKQRGG
ncbi:MAG: PAS domain S-box protein, partial [Thermoplasmata archaeon]|nr:PAS domain S-box protein [Thermoplasmata archaeon]